MLPIAASLLPLREDELPIGIEQTWARLARSRLPLAFNFEIFADGCPLSIQMLSNGMNAPSLGMEVFGLLTDLLALSEPGYGEFCTVRERRWGDLCFL